MLYIPEDIPNNIKVKVLKVNHSELIYISIRTLLLSWSRKFEFSESRYALPIGLRSDPFFAPISNNRGNDPPRIRGGINCRMYVGDYLQFLGQLVIRGGLFAWSMDRAATE